MTLTVLERLTLLDALPQTGNIATLKQVKDIREAVWFTDVELDTFKIEQVEAGQLKWNASVPQEVEIEINRKGRDLIAEALKKLDGQQKLEPRHLSLWEKFCE